MSTVAASSLPFTGVDVAQGLLANDFDPDEGETPVLQSISPSGSLGGTITLDGSGGGIYRPNPGVVEGLAPGERVTETFSYTIVSNGKTASAILTIELVGPEEGSSPDDPDRDGEPSPDDPPPDGEPPRDDEPPDDTNQPPPGDVTQPPPG